MTTNDANLFYERFSPLEKHPILDMILIYCQKESLLVILLDILFHIDII